MVTTMAQNTVLLHLDEVNSTNAFLHSYKGLQGKRMTVAVADFQTAGRGQGKNHWESEKGKNLTFSIMCHPYKLPAARQYVMLEAGALAVRDALKALTDDDNFTIKWPNDIYWKDFKVSGTLSECSVAGEGIKTCILGIGVNVNQQLFISDAPNPVSVILITGRETERELLLKDIIERMGHYLDIIDNGDYAAIDDAYKQNLYRSHGFFPYEDSTGCFEAEIADIMPNGHLLLRRRDGKISEYAFKEVMFRVTP